MQQRCVILLSFLFVSAGSLSAHRYFQENSSELCCIVVDSGFSFTHIVPYCRGKKMKDGICRLGIYSTSVFWEGNTVLSCHTPLLGYCMHWLHCITNVGRHMCTVVLVHLLQLIACVWCLRTVCSGLKRHYILCHLYLSRKTHCGHKNFFTRETWQWHTSKSIWLRP